MKFICGVWKWLPLEGWSNPTGSKDSQSFANFTSRIKSDAIGAANIVEIWENATHIWPAFSRFPLMTLPQTPNFHLQIVHPTRKSPNCFATQPKNDEYLVLGTEEFDDTHVVPQGYPVRCTEIVFSTLRFIWSNLFSIGW